MKIFGYSFFALACSLLFSVEEVDQNILLDPSLRLNGLQVQKAFSGMSELAIKSSVKLMRNDKVLAHGTLVDPRGFVVSKASDCIGARSLVTNEGLSFPVKVRKRHEECDLVLLEILNDRSDWPFVEFSDENNSITSRWAISASPDLSEIRIGVFGATSRKIGREGGVMGVVLDEKSEELNGVLVAEVIPHSAADRAGLKTGDRILKVDQRSVNLAQQVNQAMQKKDPGDLILLEISRDQKNSDIRVTLGHRSVTFDLFNRNILMSGPISKRRDNFPIILQHDIPLEYNHMGGPVFNLDGECVGINIARVDRVTNYAIPSYLLSPILNDWLSE